MAIREIRKKGDPCLEKVCHPVTEFNERLHLLLDDMRETLEESGGVGLAAPQVGILRRVCIVEDSEGEIIELVNPEIVKAEGEQTGLEGCLSLPGHWGIVTRPYTVRVRAQDRDGATFEVEDEDITAAASATRSSIWTDTCLASTATACSPTRSWSSISRSTRTSTKGKTTNEDRIHGNARLRSRIAPPSGGGRA